MTIGSTPGMTPMPAANSTTENLKGAAAPVQPPVGSVDNEATEVSSADDRKGGIDIYA